MEVIVKMINRFASALIADLKEIVFLYVSHRTASCTWCSIILDTVRSLD